MSENSELRVTVHRGGLPEEVVARITAAVKKAVRREVAAIDLLGDYREAGEVSRSLNLLGNPHGPLDGLVYVPGRYGGR